MKSLDKSCLGGFRYTSNVGGSINQTGQATAHWQGRLKAKSKVYSVRAYRYRQWWPVERSWAKGRVYMKQWLLCLIPALAIHSLEPRQLLGGIERRVHDLASRQHVRMELLIYLFTQVRLSR